MQASTRKKHGGLSAGKVKSQALIVAAMAAVMHRDFRTGRTGSLFAYEGAFIAMLRPGLCLIGWPWAIADRAARDLVGEALRQAHAERPGWAEGQRAFTQTDVTRDIVCRNCGLPLRGHQVSFCSTKCHSAWWRKFNREAA